MRVRYRRGFNDDGLFSLSSALRGWRRWPMRLRGLIKLNRLVNLKWRLGAHQNRRLNRGGSESVVSRCKASRRGSPLQSSRGSRPLYS